MHTRLIPLLLLLCLSGCTRVVEVPYTNIGDGTYRVADTVYSNGGVRDATVNDKQVLQYVTDDSGISFTHGELSFYYGSLYSLSNYRQLLLDNGYTVEAETRTSDYLDTLLCSDSDKVRLLYMKSGSVRIQFEKEGSVGHILLEERLG